MRTGKHGFSPLTRWGRSSVSLSYLESAEKPQALHLPGYRFHQLKGEYRGFYSVTVTGNDRIIFRFVDGNAVGVDYLDYH
jgi:proteic killer suppression protein